MERATCLFQRFSEHYGVLNCKLRSKGNFYSCLPHMGKINCYIFHVLETIRKKQMTKDFFAADNVQKITSQSHLVQDDNNLYCREGSWENVFFAVITISNKTFS